MTATIVPLRGYRLNDSPARWQKALRRALAEGVTVRQLATSGVWVAASGTDATAAYVVTVTACECRAGQEGDAVCKHRAMLRHTLGMLDLEPEPPTPAAPPAAPVAACRRTVVEVRAGGAVPLYRSDERPAARRTVEAPCPDCGGEGDVTYWVEAAGDEAVATCGRCNGQGTIPAPLAA